MQEKYHNVFIPPYFQNEKDTIRLECSFLLSFQFVYSSKKYGKNGNAQTECGNMIHEKDNASEYAGSFANGAIVY